MGSLFRGGHPVLNRPCLIVRLLVDLSVVFVSVTMVSYFLCLFLCLLCQSPHLENSTGLIFFLYAGLGLLLHPEQPWTIVCAQKIIHRVSESLI